MDGEIILAEYLQRLEDDGLSKRTIDNNIFVLTPFVKWLGNQEISDKTVMAYLRSLKPKNYSDSTLYQYRAVLKKFLSTISPEQARGIKLKVKKREPPIILTQEEVERLIEACRNPRDRALVSFLYESGCRKGELVSIRLENITFTEFGATVTIPRGKTGSRTLPIVYSASYLRQWIDCHPTKGSCDPLFCSLQEPFARFSFSGLSHLMRVLKERTGIKKKIYPHIFRHSRASHLANKFTEQQLKQFLGWTAGSNMAAVYVHLSQRDIEDAVLNMHGIESTQKRNDNFKVERCPRCKEINPETSKYCGKCGMPLKDEAREAIEKAEAEIDLAIMKAAVLNPEILEEIAKRLKFEK
ncbi:tyrosine-type recombinase/integrase [Methanosarcina sp. UBA289]|uniref:tyrosine-type recombinase/integrase n=1 Tax=Methanosarcina sp. UBA289 TaxID=1915574 RepID=UPI0025ED1533|nr:tyrosine-type recombinase/integrase [Methanosarcina sp. UBA289]